MNLFSLFAKIGLDDSEYKKGIDDAEKSGEGLKSKLSTLGSAAGKVGKGISTSFSFLAKGVGLAIGGVTAVTGAMGAASAATEEYRVAMGKLETAYSTSAVSAEHAKGIFNGFYQILGDTDTATEASQLLSRLAGSTQEASTWIEIAAGVAGTFGDSLPIESLIESANETAKVGEVTGTLADALNWVGISEDAFNEKLSSANSESERARIIMETLSGTYQKASDAFYENNDAIISNRQNQILLMNAMSGIGTAFDNLKNSIISGFAPALLEGSKAITSFLENANTAFQEGGFGGLIDYISGVIPGAVNKMLEYLPQVLNVGVQLLQKILEGILQALPSLVAALPQVIQSIVTAIQGLLPTVLTVGGQILEMLANGIIQYVPELIARLPEVITAFFNFLTENFPTILEKGTEILIQLTSGIIEAIPELVARLPEMINAFVNFVSENLPKIVEAGFEILTSIIKGIMDAIPELIAAVPELIDSLVNAFEKQWETIKNVGKDIIDGIIDGISAAWDGLVSWFNGLWDSLFGGRSVNVNVNKNERSIDGSHAAGLSYVPFNGYIAELHKGERVLTAQEAKDYNSRLSQPINITVNAAPQQDERMIAQYVAAELQNITNRRRSVYA